jgi:hypothetical protein
MLYADTGGDGTALGHYLPYESPQAVATIVAEA